MTTPLSARATGVRVNDVHSFSLPLHCGISQFEFHNSHCNIAPMPRPRLVTSLSVRDRISCAQEFLNQFSGQEIVLVAHTRIAADDLLRQSCARGGVFGVHRFTLPHLAFSLAEQGLAESGLAPLAAAAVDALAARAIHASRAEAPLTWFDPVADTPGFFRALGSTLTELRLNRIEPDRLESAQPSGPDLVRLLTEFERALTDNGLADRADIYRRAAAVIGGPKFRFRGTALILLDVVPRTLLEQDLIKALAAAAHAVLATAHVRDLPTIHILEGALGVSADKRQPEASQATALDRLRSYVFQPDAPKADPDRSVEFVSAADEGRECAEIARSILDLAGSGVPFDCMAIVLRNADAYQPLVEEALSRAAIPAFYTQGSRRPNPAGRALLSLLNCAAEKLSATRFAEYLSLGQSPDTDREGAPLASAERWAPVQGELFPVLQPVESPDISSDSARSQTAPTVLAGSQTAPTVLTGSQTAPTVVAGTLRTPYRWEALLVDAAVIGGRDRWMRRLDGLRNELQKQMAEAAAEQEPVRRRLERQLERLAGLRNFALPIIEFLDALPERALWNEWLDALAKLATLTLKEPDAVLSVLGELRPMGNTGPIGLSEVRDALQHRLTFLRAEPADRRYGKVFVTTAEELDGLAFDYVFLPGLAEDIFPKRQFEDPLLLDAARQLVSPWLATRNSKSADERRLLHVAAAAASVRLWISYPRMDLGRGGSRSPSFYALDVIRAIRGEIPNLDDLQRTAVEGAPSRIGWPAPLQADAAIDDAEYDLAVISELLGRPPEDARGRARYLLTANPILGRSLRTRFGRWSRSWSEGDGVVSSEARVIEVLSRHRLNARPYSATALQHFAVCPYRFLLYSILRIEPREESLAVERMDPLTRGSLLHAAQFHVLTKLRSLDLLPVRPENLSQVFAVSDEVYDAVAEKYREDLAPAIPRIWESQVEDVRWDLRGWLREMSREAGQGWTPKWFELAFGLPARSERDPASRNEPVVLAKDVRVRGAIDMIEERDGVIRITDHKTGKAPNEPPGVIGGGEILQPVLYAQAAEALLGKPAASSRLFYCTERSGYKSFEIPADEPARAELSKALDRIDRSIAEGFLPAAPRAGACDWCDYRPICGPYEESRIRRKPAERLTLLSEIREMP